MNWDQALKSAEAGAAPASNLTGLPAIIPAPELQTSTFPPVSWIVEGLLPEGHHALRGQTQAREVLAGPADRLRHCIW
jgi:hypothetical protein